MGQRDDIVIFYDNFNYMQQARHQVLGDHGIMYNYTTAKVVCGGIRMPEGGLHQSMLNRQFILKADDIIRSPDLKTDNIWKEIQRYLIFSAIKRVYPTAIENIYKDNTMNQLSMPQLDILPCNRTEDITMGAIMEDEATVVGNYRVLENIFSGQLGIDKPTGFQERLYLVYGDQKTCSLIRSCQRQRFETSDVYHRLEWALPIAGLWHLRLNYLRMIMKTFFGGRKYANQYSTLYFQINHLNRRNIPKESAPFHHVEELILHSFDARILGMLYIQIGDKCDITSSDSVSHYLSSLNVEEFNELISGIHSVLFSTRSKINRLYRETPNKSVPAVDMEFVNSIRFMQIVEVYFVLKHSIKYADLGLLRRCIARCCVAFHGSQSRNYAREMLYLYRTIATDAASPELRRTALACGLVNLRGLENSFFEADRYVELLNLQLKELMRTRGNSTFDVSHLFKWSLGITNYYLPVRAAFELAFGEWTNTEHTNKYAADDIHSLGELLSQDTLRQRRHRHVPFVAEDVFFLGYTRINEGSPLDSFHAEMRSTGDTAVNENGDSDTAENDIDLVGDYLVSFRPYWIETEDTYTI